MCTCWMGIDFNVKTSLAGHFSEKCPQKALRG